MTDVMVVEEDHVAVLLASWGKADYLQTVAEIKSRLRGMAETQKSAKRLRADSFRKLNAYEVTALLTVYARIKGRRAGGEYPSRRSYLHRSHGYPSPYIRALARESCRYNGAMEAGQKR